MLVILSVLCPPLAVLLTAPPSEFARNVGLTFLLYIPGVLHARATVEQYHTNRRYASLMRVLDTRTGPMTRRAA